MNTGPIAGVAAATRILPAPHRHGEASTMPDPRPTRPPASGSALPLVGWREWVGLPQLEVPQIKAKLDTGARTSSLHAFDLERFERKGRPWVRFNVHAKQRSAKPEIACEAEVLEERRVRSSSGHASLRPVILTPLTIGTLTWPIEITLASRDEMGFRMLLGRQALRGRCLLDPGRSYLIGKRPRKRKRKSVPRSPKGRNPS